MDISIFGLGYVGVVSAACLASRGHTVIGVDVNDTKTQMLGSGRSPIVEEEVDELLQSAKAEGRLQATTDYAAAIAESEITLVTVGTPSRPNGSLDTSFLEAVSREIGEVIGTLDRSHIVAFRSTMLPGTTRQALIPLIETESGKPVGHGFTVAYNPEFLRESTAVKDFLAPPKTVVGADDEATASAVMSLYEGLDGPQITTTVEVAETVKYADNAFHALKITFANEVGRICKSLGIDSHDVMGIFVQDRKLNISETYLKPGFAFGGSCLPKDVRALNYLAKSRDVDAPLLASLLPSNRIHVEDALDRIMSFGRRRIGIAGFAFKANTDDLRESPVVEVIETLIGKGYDLRLYDRSVALARLIGANKMYLEQHIPHISSLMVSTLQELVDHSEVLVIGNNDAEFGDLLDVTDVHVMVFDLVRAVGSRQSEGNYAGICW